MNLVELKKTNWYKNQPIVIREIFDVLPKLQDKDFLIIDKKTTIVIDKDPKNNLKRRIRLFYLKVLLKLLKWLEK